MGKRDHLGYQVLSEEAVHRYSKRINSLDLLPTCYQLLITIIKYNNQLIHQKYELNCYFNNSSLYQQMSLFEIGWNLTEWISKSSWQRQMSIMSSINGLMCSVYMQGRDFLKVSETAGGYTKWNTRYWWKSTQWCE